MNKLIVSFAVGILVLFGSADAQQTPSESSMSNKPPKPFRVVDLKSGSFVIDTPGNWVLNRSWTLEYVEDVPLNIIDVVADGVVLHFRGFQIVVSGNTDVARVAVINVQGDQFTLKNGLISICCAESGSALRSSGDGTRIEGLRGYSFDAIKLEGPGAVIRDSNFHARYGVHLGTRGTIENSVISCSFDCVNILGDDSELLNSRLLPGQLGALIIGGNGNVVAGNFVDFPNMGPELQTAIDVRGNTNIVRDNTLAADAEVFAVLTVSGAGNIIDGNIGAVTGMYGEIRSGIRFEQNGNFYGDNRMDATLPFDLGATTQADWGGNVGF